MSQMQDKELDKLIEENSFSAKYSIFKRYRIIKLNNPYIKEEIKRMRREIFKEINHDDKKSGEWIVKILTKVLKARVQTVNLKSLQAKYKTEDKFFISNKLIANYSNYSIAIGATIGATGGILGFITAATSTFAEIACLTYYQLCLIYDLSIVYEKPLSESNLYEALKVMKAGFCGNDGDLAVEYLDGLYEKGTRTIKKVMEVEINASEKAREIEANIKEIGIEVINKAFKNTISKIIPLFGVASGAIICSATDYKYTRYLGKRVVDYYKNS